ncbi:cell division protein FtsL [Thermosyntropha sp.]|uniref:cell division protein FtsL n=1 Tax=Thermosyntropha sp. TaxID=2740820 RepID=UPI0025EA2F92|nr:cell division protein FtsL [Thermosyntropha sp.]MBO8159315.1 cell division protein FtsL [Thermosyntropha sp.]
MLQAEYKYTDYTGYSENYSENFYTKEPAKGKKVNPDRARKKKLLFKVIVLFFAYALVLVYLCVKGATLDYQIVQLEKEIHQIETENLRLEYLTENSCSLENVEKIAVAELGMRKPEAKIDLAVLEPEIKPSVPEKFEVNETDTGKITEKEKPFYRLYSNLSLLAAKK